MKTVKQEEEQLNFYRAGSSLTISLHVSASSVLLSFVPNFHLKFNLLIALDPYNTLCAILHQGCKNKNVTLGIRLL